MAGNVFKFISHSLNKNDQHLPLSTRNLKMGHSPEFCQDCAGDFGPLLPCYLTECLSMSKCVFTELDVSLDNQQTETCLRGVTTDVDVFVVSTCRMAPLISRKC